MLSSHNQLPGGEDMLSSIADPSLSLDMNININIDCSELDDSYDLGEKLPFDEEMEVELKDDEFSSTPQFSNSLQTPTANIAKKANVVSAGKQAGKRKLARRVSMGFLFIDIVWKVDHLSSSGIFKNVSNFYHEVEELQVLASEICETNDEIIQTSQTVKSSQCMN